MPILLLLKGFIGNLGVKGWALVLALSLCLGFCGFTYYKYSQQLEESLKLQKQITEHSVTLSDQKHQIDDLVQKTVYQGQMITLMQGQISLANDLRKKSDADRKADQSRIEGILTKYKNEKDSNLSPKLVKILNDLEKE